MHSALVLSGFRGSPFGSGRAIHLVGLCDGKEILMPKSVKGVMDEWKSGQLHSGSKKGPVVKNQKQAVAIALSEQRQQKSGKKK
jgi:uncharacterized protein DUF6496